MSPGLVCEADEPLSKMGSETDPELNGVGSLGPNAQQQQNQQNSLLPVVPEKERQVVNETLPLMSTTDAVKTLPEVEFQYVVPDGRWGWMVLLGSVTVNTLIPGLIKSFGVMVVDIRSTFNASPTTVAWIPALTFALYNLLGPLASALSIRFSCRITTCLGGMFAAVGLALSCFANSIEYLYFSYGILGGIGAGLSYTPGVLIVGQYFKRRLGMANGLCASGSALGAIILPPLLNFLLAEYGFRGVVLIMSAVIMNVCVGAALYQPIEWHLKKVPILSSDLAPKSSEPHPFENHAITSKQINGSQLLHMPRSSDSRYRIDTIGSESYAGNCKASPISIRGRVPQPPPRFTWGSYSSVGSNFAYIDGAVSNSTNINCLGVVPNGHSYPDKQHNAETNGGPAMVIHRSPSVHSTLSTSSFAYLSTIHHGSATAAYQLSHINAPRTSDSRRGTGAASSSEPPLCVSKSVKRPQDPKQPLFDASLLCNAMFLLLTFSVVTSGIGYTNLIIVLPTFAKDLGITNAALLLSIIAGTDLAGRLCGAWMSDFTCFPRKYIYMSGYLISGLVLTVTPGNATTFEALATCCAVFGFSSGIYIGLMAVMLIDHLGAEKLANSFGLSLAINGVAMLAGPPIIGAVQESLGSYGPVIFMLGIVKISGGLIWILEPLATNYEKKKNLRLEELAFKSSKGAV